MKISDIKIPATAFARLQRRCVIDKRVAQKLAKGSEDVIEPVRRLLRRPLRELYGVGTKGEAKGLAVHIATIGGLITASPKRVKGLGVIVQELQIELQAALHMTELPIYMRLYASRSRV